MKTKIASLAKQQASTLLVTLGICTILSISLAGYLSLVSQQNKLSTRSQAWNLSIAVAEAGVEESMQHLNQNYPNLSGNGWTADGNSFYVTRTLDSNNSYYAVIVLSNSIPIIYVKAIVGPLALSQNSQPSVWIFSLFI